MFLSEGFVAREGSQLYSMWRLTGSMTSGGRRKRCKSHDSGRAAIRSLSAHTEQRRIAKGLVDERAD